MQKSLQHPENKILASLVKFQTSAELDILVHEISSEETDKMDCTTCGKCCKVLQPPFTQKDKVKLDEQDIEYIDLLVLDTSNQQHYLKNSPCNFLSDNKCTIYNYRPQACSEYPHLHLAHFKYRFKSVIEQYNICPIVYNTIERLKSSLGVC